MRLRVCDLQFGKRVYSFLPCPFHPSTLDGTDDPTRVTRRRLTRSTLEFVVAVVTSMTTLDTAHTKNRPHLITLQRLSAGCLQFAIMFTFSIQLKKEPSSTLLSTTTRKYKAK